MSGLSSRYLQPPAFGQAAR